jgi:hypothetical protein
MKRLISGQNKSGRKIATPKEKRRVTTMLKLMNDTQMDIVRDLAVPIPIALRSNYLTAIAEALHGTDPDDAAVEAAAREAQQRLLYPGMRRVGFVPPKGSATWTPIFYSEFTPEK